MNEKEHYEKEIALLKAQYRSMLDQVYKSYDETIKELYYIVRRVDGAISRGGEAVLFFNEWDEQFRVISDKRRLHKESTGSNVVGVYRKGYDKKAMLGDVCQYVDVGLR